MAKPSKGKKAFKTDQKAANREKAAGVADDRPVKPEVVVQKAQAVQVEKPKKVPPAGEPEAIAAPPVQPSGLVDRAFNFLKANASLYTVAIVLLMAFMFYLRTVPSHDLVFTNWPWINGGTYVNVAEDDGVYHMRLLENTLQHFPFRILYDPFTHFPYGNTIHFGPLFELIPAAFLLVIGLGHPSQALVDTVAAYFPSFLGMLIIIPTYYIGKKLFGRPAGFVGALAIAFMPGSFFWRSIIGSTDHHVAEVLFMACTVACLVYALDAARASDLSLARLKGSGWRPFTMPLLYAALAGIFFGSYLLSWIGGLILGLTLFAYFTIQVLMDHYRGRSLDYLLIVSAFVFLIPAIMVLPYSMANLTFQQVYYSLTQPFVLVGAFAAICVESGLSKVLRGNGADKWAFPAALVGTGIIGALVLYLIFPGLFNIMQGGLNTLTPVGGLLTVEEASPTFINRYTGDISFTTVWGMFFWTFPAALVALILLGFRVYRTRRPGEVMFFVWNLVMLWALISQNRFTYYYAVNAALLTAYLAGEMFAITDLKGLGANFAKKVDDFESLHRFVKKNTGSCLAVAFVVLIFGLIAVYPALPMSDPNGREGVLFGVSKIGTATMPHEWFDALTWMRTHTPDPMGSAANASFDYWGGQYYKPSGQPRYDYPSTAYGVMSWWDYGHDIEYVAQRIPNANPFQAGIIEENGTTGASPYFTATDEATSVRMLDQLGTRYVVIDNQMATGKFNAIQKWINATDGWETRNNSSYIWMDDVGPRTSGNITVPVYVDTQQWDNSIMNRLYYEDADGMQHYRLVYESSGLYNLNRRATQLDAQTRQVTYAGLLDPVQSDNLTSLMDSYLLLSNYVVATDESGTTYFYGARMPEKWVKVFEKVKGATITGSAPAGASVTATVTLATDWNRTFDYTATATAHNGIYAFVVPYPTEQMKGAGYSYGILPRTKYAITYGNVTKSVDVPETAVMDGAIIQVA